MIAFMEALPASSGGERQPHDFGDVSRSASQTALPAAMDLTRVRKTADGKVSVIDVITQMKKCTGNYAAQVYKRLLEEERVPKCEVRSIVHTASEGSTANCS